MAASKPVFQQACIFDISVLSALVVFYYSIVISINLIVLLLESLDTGLLQVLSHLAVIMCIM